MSVDASNRASRSYLQPVLASHGPTVEAAGCNSEALDCRVRRTVGARGAGTKADSAAGRAQSLAAADHTRAGSAAGWARWCAVGAAVAAAAAAVRTTWAAGDTAVPEARSSSGQVGRYRVGDGGRDPRSKAAVEGQQRTTAAVLRGPYCRQTAMRSEKVKAMSRLWIRTPTSSGELPGDQNGGSLNGRRQTTTWHAPALGSHGS